MSTITLAAQRSYTLNAPVWFSYRRPSLKKVVCSTLIWAMGIVMTIAAGLYAHLYWDLRHPVPEPIKASAVKPETTLSDMHYVYVSKPFPQPEPKQEPVTKEMPPLQEMPIDSGDADWQQAPDGEMPHDISRETLPGTEVNHQNLDDGAIKALLMKALKEQEKDYSQGKMPTPPEDETTAGTQANNSLKHSAPFT
ncbi:MULTISPECIES: hypothetical protein [Enterobacter]|uniref:Uncharacterized protein n=1 Tax=Enterobacter dykesii TaxID=2797506 RepID=A0AAU7J4V2_9ENTR|nr:MULTISPECIES: hypothetical protein [Enterobacter]KAA0528413.1 hypothetical protein F0321_02630 [Enterobacter asburiae]KAA0533486.1 hypothetical protein F0320_10775 [Enterobacter dykesii]RTN82745.1 hypothetical protein EKN81_01050 [Enterobacter asburiae]RTP81148.1 hypothetical protein EKN32_01050 [Enterobacter asburiae]